MRLRTYAIAIALVSAFSLVGAGYAYTVSIENAGGYQTEAYILVSLCNSDGTVFTDYFYGTPSEEGGKIRLDNGAYVKIDNVRSPDISQRYDFTISLSQAVDQDMLLVLDGTERTITAGDTSALFSNISGGTPLELRIYSADELGTEETTMTMTATQHWVDY